MEPRMYTLVRRDLPLSQLVVQVAHAVAEYLLHHKPENWDNGKMVVMGVENKTQLSSILTSLKAQGVCCATFEEPDFNRGLTAFSFVYQGRCPLMENLSLL